MVPAVIDVVTISMPRMANKAMAIRTIFGCTKVKGLTIRSTGCRSCGLLVVSILVAKFVMFLDDFITRAIGRRVSPEVGSSRIEM